MCRHVYAVDLREAGILNEPQTQRALHAPQLALPV
jgi:hypothetical protein